MPNEIEINTNLQPTEQTPSSTGEVDAKSLIGEAFGDGQKPQPEEKKEEAKDVKPNIDEITERERKYFRERQQWVKEREQMKKELEALKTAKPKNEEEDDIDSFLKKYLEPESKEEKEDDEDKPLTKKQIAALLEEREKTKQEEEKQTIAKMEEEIAIEKFKGQIGNFVTKASETSPLFSTIGNTEEQTDHIYDMIEQDYMRKAEEFGEEYASKNLMTPEQAIQRTEKVLASQLKTMLTSNSKYRALVAQYLSEIGEAPSNNSTQPKTLSNSLTNTTDANYMDDEMARIARATAVAEKAFSR